FSTLHTLDAPETITRIVAAFPPYQQKQVRLQLGSILKAVISQRLVPRADGRGRVAAVEIMRATARVKEMIEDKDRTKELHDAIAQGVTTYGMQTFDQSLMQLLTSQLITYEEALRQATNADDFALRVSGIGGTSDSSWDAFDGSQNGLRPGMQASQLQGANAQAPLAPQAPPAGGQIPRPQAAAPRPVTAPQGVPQPQRAQSNPFQQPVPARPAPQPAPQPTQSQSQSGAPVNPDDDFQIERF
ncbi:MAG TPA: type IV pili twitching motility protein PilT, partial [Myxococcota bacterium]